MEIVRQNREDVEVCNLAAIVARKKNDLAASVMYYRKALEKAPSNYRIMYNLALAYRYLGDLKKAHEYAKLVKKNQPGFDKIDQLLLALGKN